MPSVARLPVENGNPVRAMQELLRRLLAEDDIVGVFAPRQPPAKGAVMPSLITDPEALASVDPASPSFPVNAAQQVARLTRGDLDGKLIAVLRPCELRAFTELVKLNQGSLQNLIIVGADCHGAFDNDGFRAFMESNGGKPGIDNSADFLRRVSAGEFTAAANGGPALARACRACEHPAPEHADLTIGLFGQDTSRDVLLIPGTAQGEALVSRLGLATSGSGAGRDEALTRIRAERTAYRDAMFEETRAATATPAKLAEYLAACVGCYNCRAACPVCYCRECVFLTDVFAHEPWQYLGWARQKGALRMPTDTLFFHLTRMAHMSLSCVGCGQCSNACPNDIGVMELFRTVAARTQSAFDYEAGRNPDEKPPLTVFHQKEFAEVTGGHD